MKHAPASLLLAAALLVSTLPSSWAQLQPAQPLPADPVAALQALQTANDDLIKRQETTLKDLTDMTTDAREARIFVRRG